MHKNEDITIDSITKIEGNAELRVKIGDDGKVSDLKFIIEDYKRFYTDAVKHKYYGGVPSTLSRICGTCSTAHLIASIEAIEKAFGIHDKVTPQTILLRNLTMNGMIIRDHALHLYIFSLPDVLGIDSILDISDDDKSLEHQLLHDGFDLKAVGNKLSTTFAGAAVHAPYPVVGGFLKTPKEDLNPLIEELKGCREKVLRGMEVFFNWKEVLNRNTDFIALVNDKFNFLDGKINVDNRKIVSEEDFPTLLSEVVIPYSQSMGYTLKDSKEDFMTGSLARVNLNKASLNVNTLRDAKKYVDVFPSINVYHNCLAQAIEILHCIDNSIEILTNLKLVDEKPITFEVKAGEGVGVIEAPRGTLYHRIKLDEKGIVIDADVVVPTSQNVINIENDLKEFFNQNVDKLETPELKKKAEEIIRAYDPCMSCTTNFLKIKVER